MDDNRLIDDYILGLLNEEELNLFEEKLKTDEKFVAQLNMRKGIINGIEAFGRQNLKEELKNIHQEVISQKVEKPAKERRLIPYIAVAATISILVIALFWLLNFDSNPSHNDLYSQYFAPYTLSIAQRSDNKEVDIKISQLYNDKKYKEVIPLLKTKLQPLAPKPSSLLLATGIAHLEIGQAKDALKYFNQITANEDFNFENEVQWYSALAYLKLGDIKLCKKQLQSLVNDPKADHHQTAKELIEKLD